MKMAVEIDQDQRDQMRERLDANIAVRAAAGSGKTRSTVDRIVAMALHEDYRQFLPHLVVVTYTNAAADELRTRARKRLIEEHHEKLKHLAGDIIPKFGQIFFGTIHSFCMRILGEFGHQIGLPSGLESIEDRIDEIHEKFRRDKADEVWESLDPREALRIFRFGIAFEDLIKIGKELSMLPVDCAALSELPDVEGFDLLKQAEGIKLDPAALDGAKTTARNVEVIQDYIAKYKEFCASWNSQGEEGTFVAMLGAPKSKAADIVARSERALTSVHDWYVKGILKLGLKFASAFQAYRWEKGALTYHDQIILASKLIAKPDVLRTLRSRSLRVILDEAQDTTPEQFRILSEIARPLEATGSWPGSAVASPPTPKPAPKGPLPPRSGHFVMVGDEQQCIFASTGAQIESYMRYGAAIESIVFRVTFRCSHGVIRFVNGRFANILHGREGQAQFTELAPRSGAEEGRVGRIELPWAAIRPEGKSITSVERFEKEMELLAAAIKQLGPKGLGAARWSEVAILMPRNNWLTSLAGHLDRAGIPSRMTARRNNESAAAWRWFAALLAVLAGHDDGYELAGVLREIFGISDAEAAAWVFSGKPLQLKDSTDPRADSKLARTLGFLRDLQRRMEELPALAAVDEMLRTCAFPQRVAALREIPEVLRGPGALLDSLRARAAQAEAEGLSWKNLAEDLLSEREEDMPEFLPADGKDAVVLMTCQKAKGQEWPVVILPGLRRELQNSSGNKEIIKILRHEGKMACRTRGARTRNWKEIVETQAVQREHEMRRVYYVACTRAKRHLILIDAGALWAIGGGKKSESKRMTPLRALSAPGEEEKWLAGIEPWGAPEPVREIAAASQRVEPLPADIKAVSRVTAPKILHPSQSGDDDRIRKDPDQDQERSRSEPRVEPLRSALIYGEWWHDAMFHADWSSADLDQSLRASVEKLPAGSLRERGRREIETLLRSKLFAELSQPDVSFHRELAYTRSPALEAIEDGTIDLIYRIGEQPWRVVDWKTGVVKDRTEAEIHARDRYKGQLTTYVDALQRFGLATGEARLYFTAVGETVKV
jgi:ATP-dependent exoDNAse (exonuclease V) beta subunit